MSHLVFLHGVFMDHTLWDRIPLDGLRLDMPWHGAGTDLPADATMQDHCADIAGQLDRCRITGAVLVGHSWGGMVALRLAEQRSDLVAGLVLVNTPLRRVTGLTRAGFHAQRAILGLGFPPGWYGRMAARSLISAEHRKRNPRAAASLAERTSAMGRARLRATLRSVLLEPTDAVEKLEALPQPWAAVAGAQDYVLGGGMRQRLEASGRLTVARGSHTSPREDPDTVTGVIRGLLAAVDR